MSFFALAFLIGIIIGFTAHYTRFCIFGSIAEWIGLGETRRLLGVIAAIFIFSFIHFWGFQGNISCGGVWKGYPGLNSFIGGFIQGIGYVLIIACPFTLLVRLGEGSKSHIFALIFFALGISLFGYFREPIVDLLSPFTIKTQTFIKSSIWVDESKKFKKHLSYFNIQTIDGGKIEYQEGKKSNLLIHQSPNGNKRVLENPILLIYIAPPCCPFCYPQAVDYIKELENKFTKQGLVVLGIFRDHSIDDTIKPFIKEYNTDWILARDPEYKLLKRFDITPETFLTVMLIDKKGDIRLKQEGFREKHLLKYKQEISLIIKNK
ncbi:MAG: YeeE/YedE family protein [Armatimonadetes bacterium]|nr:YeeE/YedE family protein [Armatimonadota bacterium]